MRLRERGAEGFGAGPLADTYTRQIEHDQATNATGDGLLRDGSAVCPLPGGAARKRAAAFQVERKNHAVAAIRLAEGAQGRRPAEGFEPGDNSPDPGLRQRSGVLGLANAGVHPETEAVRL